MWKLIAELKNRQSSTRIFKGLDTEKKTKYSNKSFFAEKPMANNMKGKSLLLLRSYAFSTNGLCHKAISVFVIKAVRVAWWKYCGCVCTTFAIWDMQTNMIIAALSLLGILCSCYVWNNTAKKAFSVKTSLVIHQRQSNTLHTLYWIKQ